MKNIVFTILLLLGAHQAFSCSCAFSDPVKSFGSADFVGQIKITKVYPNESSEEIYKADIEITELLKGPKINSIFIAGRSDGKIGSSCAIFYPEGSELIVAARQNKGGKLVFGMCSYKINLNANRRHLARDIKLIQRLSQLDTIYSQNFNYTISQNFLEFLSSKKGLGLSTPFALYEVVLSPDFSPIEIKVIDGFNDSLDQEVMQELKKSTWNIKRYGVNDYITHPIKLIFPLFYYPPEKSDPSFLSQFAL